MEEFLKPKKNVTILEESMGRPLKNMTILDIGTGNGEIANYIAGQGNDVYSVDVQKVVKDKETLFHFLEVKDEALPFKDNFFDIVISNHVIEHVGDGMKHLREMHRVLKTDGRGYFATPNRNFPKEVHTSTFLIHWLPYDLFWKFFKLLHKYQEPIRLLSHRKMKKEFTQVGFDYREYTIKIINNPLKYCMNSKWRVKLPQFFSAIAPTNIFILSKSKISVC